MLKLDRIAAIRDYASMGKSEIARLLGVDNVRRVSAKWWEA